MRPPDLPGGNLIKLWRLVDDSNASMRPPDLPGGNPRTCCRRPRLALGGFNEAAGFTRRKRGAGWVGDQVPYRASMRPPDLPGGNVVQGEVTVSLELPLQ